MFVNYIRKNYGSELATNLEDVQHQAASMLAFDLDDEDDEFGFNKQ